MSNIIIQNTKRTIKFNKFPSSEEIELINLSYPNLKEIIFQNAVISNFSLIEIFKKYNLTFLNCTILEQNYPITLNGTKIHFENTKIDFRKFFFMTNMPNLKDIGLLYDSIEGINLYKPFIHLLKFFPLLERIRLLMITDKTYYDIDHTKEYEKTLICNSNLLYEVLNNLEFINYLPYYQFNANDGLYMSKKMDYNIWQTNKRIWINPKYMIYFNNLKYDDLKKIKEIITKLSKYGPNFRKRLGINKLEYDFKENPINSCINLKERMTRNLSPARLQSHIKLEDFEPDISKLYGPFGEKLYSTKGDYIIVNSMGNIISHYSVNKNTKKLKNELLPF